MSRGEGSMLYVAGQPYAWTINSDGKFEAVSLARLADAATLVKEALASD